MLERWWEPIRRWCRKVGVPSGGHLLLEENILHHVPLYGDAFAAFRHMDSPGIDCLSSDPAAPRYRSHAGMGADIPWNAARLASMLTQHTPRPRLGAVMFAAFGLLAGLLTLVGIYGLISYSVGQRTREMGIRMALGATSLDIVREFLTSALGMIAIGGVLGTLGAIVAVRMMSTMLFQVRPMDAITFGAVLMMLTGTALLATFIPARRAAKTDPAIALRHD